MRILCSWVTNDEWIGWEVARYGGYKEWVLRVSYREDRVAINYGYVGYKMSESSRVRTNLCKTSYETLSGMENEGNCLRIFISVGFPVSKTIACSSCASE